MRIISKEKFGGQIINKHVLFDTNVLIRACYNFNGFEGFFKFLKKYDCSPAYFPLIKFEFIGPMQSKEHKGKREKFLINIPFEVLPTPTTDNMNDAIGIANAYGLRQVGASLVDCCITAYLKQYSSNLFLATLNHKHFPTFLLDSIFIYPIDTGKEILPMGFYKFNNAKAKKILKS